MKKIWTRDALKSGLQLLQTTEYSWHTLPKRHRLLSDLKKAAVLIPLFVRNGDLFVWLTLRSEAMRNDKGHVSFPGGHKDAVDVTEYDTCTREAHEEIGLMTSQVELVGHLHPVINMRQLLITPVLGIVDPTFVPRPNEEVEVAFCLPLARFLSQRDHVHEQVIVADKDYYVHFFTDEIDGKQITTWGLTSTLCTEIAVVLFDTGTEYAFRPNGERLTKEHESHCNRSSIKRWEELKEKDLLSKM